MLLCFFCCCAQHQVSFPVLHAFSGLTKAVATDLSCRLRVVQVCSSCRLTKPSTEFYTNKTAADMLHSLCKQCHGDKCRSRASGNYDVSVVDKVPSKPGNL